MSQLFTDKNRLYLRKYVLNGLSNSEMDKERIRKSRIKKKAESELVEEHYQGLVDAIDLSVFLYYDDPRLHDQIVSEMSLTTGALSEFIKNWYDERAIELICKNISIPERNFINNQKESEISSNFILLKNSIELLSRLELFQLRNINGVGAYEIADQINDSQRALIKLYESLIGRGSSLKKNFDLSFDLVDVENQNDNKWINNIVKQDRTYKFPQSVAKPNNHIIFVRSGGKRQYIDGYEVEYHLELEINAILSILKSFKGKKSIKKGRGLSLDKHHLLNDGVITLFKLDDTVCKSKDETESMMVRNGFYSPYEKINEGLIGAIRYHNSIGSNQRLSFNISINKIIDDFSDSGIKKYFGERTDKTDGDCIQEIITETLKYENNSKLKRRWDFVINESYGVLESIGFIKMDNERVLIQNDAEKYLDENDCYSHHCYLRPVIDSVKKS